MAIFTVKIACDNAAFYEGDSVEEVKRCLRSVIDTVECDTQAGNIRDSNGNIVGWYGFE